MKIKYYIVKYVKKINKQLDNFDKMENIGRAKLKEYFNKVLKKSGYNTLAFIENKYSKFDAILIDKIRKIIVVVEIKNRSRYYLRYNDVFAEEDKINALDNIRIEIMLNKPNYTVKTMYFYSYDNSNVLRFVFPSEDGNQFFKTNKMCNITTAAKSEKKLKKCIIYTKYNEVKID